MIISVLLDLGRTLRVAELQIRPGSVGATGRFLAKAATGVISEKET